MIVHSKEPKPQATLVDLLKGTGKTAASDTKGVFSKLLAALDNGMKGGEKPQPPTAFKAVVDPKNGPLPSAEPQKGELKELQSLLKGSEASEEKGFISAELVRTLSGDQVRTLIHRAKEYLKNEIVAQAPEYQNDAKPLPKNLAGLIQLAEKLGLEPVSVTLSTVAETEDAFTPELLSKPLLDIRPLAQRPAAAPTEGAGRAETLVQLLGEVKTKELKQTSEVPAPSDKEEPLKALLRQNFPAKADAQTDPLAKEEAPLSPKTAQPAEAPRPVIKEEAPLPKPAPLLSDQAPKTQPLLQAAPTEEKKSEEKTSQAAPLPSAAKTDGLIALLQGESESSTRGGETAKNSQSETESARHLHVSKPDSLEVKSKEAQQSMRHFAIDLKEAAENYKPPFTRLSMKLNPEKLGEVEVTLVQRGNNVHVNIQSNNAASVAFLAHNATELKAQLAHQGITNATMNFMSGGENPNPQQQHQHPHNRFRAYESLLELEQNEEQLSALEIIIPHYA